MTDYLNGTRFIAIYEVNGQEWPSWPSLSSRLDTCRELFMYWYKDLPVDMKADRSLKRIATVQISETS